MNKVYVISKQEAIARLVVALPQPVKKQVTIDLFIKSDKYIR